MKEEKRVKQPSDGAAKRDEKYKLKKTNGTLSGSKQTIIF